MTRALWNSAVRREMPSRVAISLEECPSATELEDFPLPAGEVAESIGSRVPPVLIGPQQVARDER